MKRPGGFDGPAPVPQSAKQKVRSVAAPRPASDASVEQASAPRGVKQAREALRAAERVRRKREKQEQRRFTSHIHAKRRRRAVVVFAVLGLAAFIAIGVFTPIMAVREIDVRGAETVDAAELQQALGRFEGVPLALVTDGDVHQVLEPFPLIQRYAVERIPPHTLVVRIEERTAVVAFERKGGFDLLDAAGVLTRRVDERPVGVPLATPELSDTSSPEFRAAAGVVRDMPQDMRDQLDAVRAGSAQDVSFTLIGGTEVIWGGADNTQRKAVVLRSMLNAVKKPSMIDVSAPEAPVFR